MANNALVATRVPPAVMDQINADMETGYYRTVADWVRIACIEYAQKRKRDRQGGGALIKLYARAKKRGGGAAAPRCRHRFY